MEISWDIEVLNTAKNSLQALHENEKFRNATQNFINSLPKKSSGACVKKINNYENAISSMRDNLYSMVASMEAMLQEFLESVVEMDQEHTNVFSSGGGAFGGGGR